MAAAGLVCRARLRSLTFSFWSSQTLTFVPIFQLLVSTSSPNAIAAYGAKSSQAKITRLAAYHE